MPTKKLDLLSIILIGAFTATIFLLSYLIYIYFFVYRASPPRPATPQTTLSIRVIITNISADTVTIQPNSTLPQITTIKITNQTNLSRSTPTVPYAFPDRYPPFPDQPKLALKDLRPGELIIVLLNLPPADEKEAIAIDVSLPIEDSAFNGTVIAIDENIFSVKRSTTEKVYAVATTRDTEFTKPVQAQPTIIDPTEIRVGDTVIVFTDANVADQTKVNALKLDLVE